MEDQAWERVTYPFSGPWESYCWDPLEHLNSAAEGQKC